MRPTSWSRGFGHLTSPSPSAGDLPIRQTRRTMTSDVAALPTTDPRRDGHAKTAVRKAVFPAAGLGTRFLPATKAQAKEMLTLVDKPIIQYGVEEAVGSGVRDIVLVTSRGKSA